MSDQALIRCTINWSVSDQLYGHLMSVWSVPDQNLIRPIRSFCMGSEWVGVCKCILAGTGNQHLRTILKLISIDVRIRNARSQRVVILKTFRLSLCSVPSGQPLLTVRSGIGNRQYTRVLAVAGEDFFFARVPRLVLLFATVPLSVVILKSRSIVLCASVCRRSEGGKIQPKFTMQGLLFSSSLSPPLCKQIPRKRPTHLAKVQEQKIATALHFVSMFLRAYPPWHCQNSRGALSMYNLI